MLITLGVIVLVACMTMPGVIKNYQKKVAVERLKQTYSMLKQAAQMSEVKNGEMTDWLIPGYDTSKPTAVSGTTAVREFVQMYYEPYLQTIHKDELKSSSTPYDYFYYTNDGQRVESAGHTLYSIALINGVYLHFNANLGVSSNITLRIDINGKQNPNTIGIDTFYILAYPRIELVGEGESRETLLNRCKTSNNESSQMFCGALIMADGWEIRDDYPWR